MPQQALRREHDERKRVTPQQRGLSPQDVKVLRGRRAVHDAHVDVGRPLEETLRTCTRVLGSLTFVSVRRQEHERGLQRPLRASRRHELVDYDLRAVDEVAVLRFPDDEAIGFLDVVAKLESDDTGSAERAVMDLERRARLRERLERDERLAAVRVVEHGVTLAERAPLDVLT